MTPDHFCHYKVMAFGMRNAPATFQHLVNKVLEGVTGCEAYLDDLVIHSSSWPQHLDQLEDVFKRLKAAKCEFRQATVTYLGKVVGHGRRRVSNRSESRGHCELSSAIFTEGIKAGFWVWQDIIGVFAEM